MLFLLFSLRSRYTFRSFISKFVTLMHKVFQDFGKVGDRDVMCIINNNAACIFLHPKIFVYLFLVRVTAKIVSMK